MLEFLYCQHSTTFELRNDGKCSLGGDFAILNLGLLESGTLGCGNMELCNLGSLGVVDFWKF